jgi:2,7-dihydroxy-5-methyl-1-naphthoate 7-O-methyltransferase
MEELGNPLHIRARPRTLFERPRRRRVRLTRRGRTRDLSAHKVSLAVTDIWALSDLCTPWCVHVAATLRIADHISAGFDHIDRLAEVSGANAEALRRVLRHLVEHAVFEEPEPGRFALNETARALLDPGIRLGLDLDSIGGRMAYAWGTMISAVRTGEPAYHTVFGRPFWDDLEAHPAVAVSFDELMGPAGHGTPDPDVLLGGDWSSVCTVVDVGGGTGALLAEVLKAHPNLRGTLVDRPTTVTRSQPIFEAAGVAERVTVVGQSFFDPLPQGRDLYLLKSVLSDWPDLEARVILRRCAEAARPAGRVVLLNGVAPDDPRGASPDLLMLVLVGGKNRTLSEFRDLARSAGLEVHQAGRLSNGRFIVECRAAASQPTSPDARDS